MLGIYVETALTNSLPQSALGSFKFVFDRAHATRTRPRFNYAASFFILSDKQDPHLHWPRSQNPDGLPLGFEPWSFGMVGEHTTAEPQTCWLTFLSWRLAVYATHTWHLSICILSEDGHYMTQKSVSYTLGLQVRLEHPRAGFLGSYFIIICRLQQWRHV